VQPLDHLKVALGVALIGQGMVERLADVPMSAGESRPGRPCLDDRKRNAGQPTGTVENDL
jgi:hypothetical protein